MPKEEAGWLCDHQSQILFYLTRSVKVNIKPPVKMSKITAAKQTSKLYFQNSMLIPAMFSLESTMLTNLKRSIMPPSRRRNIGRCWPRSTPLLWFLPPTYFSVQLAPYRNPLTPPLPQIRGKRCPGRNFTQHALSNTFTILEPEALKCVADNSAEEWVFWHLHIACLISNLIGIWFMYNNIVSATCVEQMVDI